MLRINTLSHQKIYQADLTKQQTDELSKFAVQNPRSLFSHIKPLIVPLRTDTLSHFVIDLFLPATYHAAIKIDDAVNLLLL